MSFLNTYTLTLDIKKSIANQIPTFVANDSAVLYINVTNNGETYDISNAERYTVSFERKDKQIVTGLGTYENGMVRYQLGSTEMELEGDLHAVVQIYQGDTRISSKPFKLKITHDWIGNIGSETELTLLQELFIETKTNSDFALEQGNFAKTQAENLTHKGEYSSTVAYKSNNVLSYGGINYICIKDTTAGILPTDGTYFTVVSPQARFNTKTWTATEGQTVFTITNGSYVINSGNIDVTVGGIPQTSGIGFTETNSTSITLSEGVSAGVVVTAKWVEGAFSISKTHKSSHEVGGQDELDVTKLKNFDQIAKTGNEYEWTATAGQLTYILPSNAKYDPNSKWLEVIVGGAPVEPSKIQKDNDSQFTLLVSSSYIPEGVKVVARWVEPYIPATSGHKGSHEAGGYDEIDVTKLKNYSVITSALADIVNINDFPRLVAEVSDSPRIQRAIDSFKTTTTGATIEAIIGAVNTKRTILLPPGRLIVSQSIKLPSYIQFVGSGRHTTILESSITDGSPVILVDGNDATTTHAFYNTIKGFSIDGKNLNCQGIKFNFAHRWTLDDVFIGSTRKEALYFWESYIGDVQSCYVFGCGDVGVPSVKLDARAFDYGNHAINFYGGEIVGSRDYGLYLHYGAAISIYGTTIEGNTKAGLVIDDTISTLVSGVYFEQNVNHIEVLKGNGISIKDNYYSLLKSGSLGDIGIGVLYGGSIEGNTFATVPSAGMYHLFKMGLDADRRFRSSNVNNNYCASLPMQNDPALITLAKTSGTIISTDDLTKKITYGKPNYVDGLSANEDISSTKSVSVNGRSILSGSGTPASVVSASKGSLFLRSDGGIGDSLYGKIVEGGSTGWRPIQMINSGDTASRPTGAPAGFQYFDTTLTKPIWYTGSTWRDATGTVV